VDAWFVFFLFTVAILFAIGGSLILVAYVVILPASFAQGWKKGLLALLLPLVGPIWLANQQRDQLWRPLIQIVSGVILLAIALGLLYLAGPYFVDRMALGVK